MLRRFVLLLAGLTLSCALIPAAARARPYTVDDLVRMEAFGATSVDPADRRLVFERLRPRTAAAAFDHGWYTRHLRSELFVADLERPGPARRLLPDVEGIGHVLGPWSPSGRRLLVYRLRNRRWTAGVVDVERGGVRWLEASPEIAQWGRTAQWRSDDALVMIIRPDGAPRPLSPWAATDRTTARWAAAREGREPSRTEIGAGAYAGRSPRSPPNRLVVVDAATGRVRPLAEGRFHDLELSASGRFAAVLGFEEPLPVDLSVPFLQGQWPYRRAVRVVDLQSGRAWSAAPDRDVLPNLLAWSPAADVLLVWSRSQGEDWPAGELTSLDAPTRTSRFVDVGAFGPLILETPALRTPVIAADWLGGDPVLLATGPDGRRDWVRAGARPARLTSALPQAPSRLAARAADRLWLFADGALWELAGDGARRLTPPGAAVRPAPLDRVDLGQRFHFNSPPPLKGPPLTLAAAPPDGEAAPRRETAGSLPQLAERRVLALTPRTRVVERVDDRYRQTLRAARDAGPEVEIARINDHYADIAFAPARPVRHAGPSGEPLTSWLYPPSPDAPRARRGAPPLVVSPYPGRVEATPSDATGENPMINVAVLSGAGFAVLLPALPREATTGEPARNLAAQVLAAVDAAAAGGGFDPERLALWGHSFGGYAAVAAAAQTDRFDAVVAASGPYNLAAAWGEFAPDARALPEEGSSIRSAAGWAESGQGEMGGPPWTDPGRWMRNSPLFAADRISAPVLLIASDRDLVASAQAEALFTALHRQNKDAVLLTYFGEGHVFQSPANIRDVTNYVLRWLGDALGRDSPSEPARAAAPAPPPPSAPTGALRGWRSESTSAASGTSR